MPKTRETEYRSRAGVEDEAEDRAEQVEDKPEYTERARVRDLLKKQKGAPQNLG